MSPEDAPRRRIRDRYALGRRLGGGGQGTTWEAVDEKDGRVVALKEFRVRGAASWKDVELAEREASVLSRLDHPQLPRYLDHFEEDGALYLVMEMVVGTPLTTRDGARHSVADVLRFLADADRILVYLHGHSPPVIHRDIKPSNVIRRPDGSFALVDFGAVRDELRPEGGSTVVGTFGYMAPEQFQGRASPATDVFAVGATALVMLTGVSPEDLPHRGLGIDVEAALKGTPVPPELRGALARMLLPDPDQRAASIGPLLQGVHESPTERVRPGGGGEGSVHFDDPDDAWETLRVPPGIVFALVIAFGLARVAIRLVLGLLLPMLLLLLVPLGGQGLRSASRAVRHSASRADEAVSRAARSLRTAPKRKRRRRRRAQRIRIDEAFAPRDEDREMDDQDTFDDSVSQSRRRRR